MLEFNNMDVITVSRYTTSLQGKKNVLFSILSLLIACSEIQEHANKNSLFYTTN